MNEPNIILLAEDNAHDVELTLAALMEHNVANDIVVVNDGAQALDYLFSRGKFAGRKPGQPALCLLDLKMPKVDGLEVLRTIKQDEKLRAIPVVMLTSSREEPDLVRAYQLGVNSYVLKPVEFQAFVDAVKNLGVYWTVHNQRPASRG
jgi:CheY-like chemotaxis protein